MYILSKINFKKYPCIFKNALFTHPLTFNSTFNPNVTYRLILIVLYPEYRLYPRNAFVSGAKCQVVLIVSVKNSAIRFQTHIAWWYNCIVIRAGDAAIRNKIRRKYQKKNLRQHTRFFLSTNLATCTHPPLSPSPRSHRRNRTKVDRGLNSTRTIGKTIFSAHALTYNNIRKGDLLFLRKRELG